MSTLTSAHIEVPPALIDGLQARSRHPPRAYHSRSHIEAMIWHFEEVAAGPGWQRPLEVLLSGRKDNEAKSAEVAREVIASQFGDRSVDVNRVAELINLTAQHGRLEASALDHDSAHFLVCDMAIVGASQDPFDAYDQGVAEEYAPHVNGILYQLGRRRFLSKLLGAKQIFLTEFFHSQLDAPVRANLRRALAR